MITIFIVTLIAALVFTPQLWIRYTLKRYSAQIEEFPGTGGQLAKHLLKRFAMDDIQLEHTEKDENYYDPTQKLVRLSEQNYYGKSLTAITIATHEVGHAIQHRSNYKPLLLRGRLVRIAFFAEKSASIILVSFPFVSVLTKMPIIGAAMLAGGVIILILPVIVHLITLPVEWDASFRRALPILIEGEYISPSAIPSVKKILTAAALSYLAASLYSLLNFYRWLRFLRR